MTMFGVGAFDLFNSPILAVPADLSESGSISDAIIHWLKTVCSNNSEAIVNLYAVDGVLLGTVAENIKFGRQEIASYFDMFVKKRPCGEITYMDIHDYGEVAVVNGNYTFELEDEGQRKKVPARFTFVLKKVSGRWKIATHHSSERP